MGENIFLEGQKYAGLSEYMKYNPEGRQNLGDQVPVFVYRMLEYSLMEQLEEQFGKETQAEIFRNAGFRAGKCFAAEFLDLDQPFGPFVSQLQRKLEEYRIGVLRIEEMDERMDLVMLAVYEDAGCAGLPVLGETACNFEEGFWGGILTAYTGKEYCAVETDCWTTGDRVCRFCVRPREK